MWNKNEEGLPKRLGEFEQIVLLALMRLGDRAYGVTIRLEAEARSKRAVSLSAVYTTLERLEKRGLVESFIGEPSPERGGRRKKHFRMSPAGEQALAESYRMFRRMTAGLETELEKL